VSAAPNGGPPIQINPGEVACYAAIIEAARLSGWRTHHQRSTRNGTPISGDPGFPDFVLVHPRGHVLFVEVKSDRHGARLTLDQERWGDALIRAGARWSVVRVPSGLGAFCQSLADLGLGA
jgi:hypothetical protein